MSTNIHATQKWVEDKLSNIVPSEGGGVGLIKVPEQVVGKLNNILVYDKNGNSTTIVEDVYDGLFEVYVKFTSDNPDDLEYYTIPERHLLMEQRIVIEADGANTYIVQTILKDNVIYTRSITMFDLSGENPNPDYNFVEWNPFYAINLSPSSYFDSDNNKNTPLSVYAGKVLNEQKEEISNKSLVIDNTADDTKYPTTKAVKDFVEEVSGGIIDVEYESDNHQVNSGDLRTKIEYYDSKGNSVDLNNEQAREKLSTGLYRIKVKSTWDIPEIDDDLNEIGRKVSNAIAEDIVFQRVIKYDTTASPETMYGNLIVNQYLISSLSEEDLKWRQAIIKIDGSVVSTGWQSVLHKFELSAYRVSDIENPEYEGYEEEYYPNIKAVKDYVGNISGNNIRAFIDENKVLRITKSDVMDS